MHGHKEQTKGYLGFRTKGVMFILVMRRQGERVLAAVTLSEETGFVGMMLAFSNEESGQLEVPGPKSQIMMT